MGGPDFVRIARQPAKDHSYGLATYPANLCPIEFGASKERFATAHDHSAQ